MTLFIAAAVEIFLFGFISLLNVLGTSWDPRDTGSYMQSVKVPFLREKQHPIKPSHAFGPHLAKSENKYVLQPQ